MTLEAVALALAIFGLRLINNAISTVRLVVLNRDQRLLATVLAVFESLIFALSLGPVLADLSNILNLAAYCGGYAIGGYVGQVIEAHFVTAFMTVNVIVPGRARTIADSLRQRGFGVTETVGEGASGVVTTLRSVVNRQDVGSLISVVRHEHPDAFVTVEEARAVQRGWLRAARPAR